MRWGWCPRASCSAAPDCDNDHDSRIVTIVYTNGSLTTYLARHTRFTLPIRDEQAPQQERNTDHTQPQQHEYTYTHIHIHTDATLTHAAASARTAPLAECPSGSCCSVAARCERQRMTHVSPNNERGAHRSVCTSRHSHQVREPADGSRDRAGDVVAVQSKRAAATHTHQ
jgi:hypothetical protein